MKPSGDLKRYPLHQSPFYKLRNGKKLAVLLGLDVSALRRMSKRTDECYKEFPVAKKTGGTRDVENPARELKIVQARIARWLGRIAPPDYLFCPVKGRCYVSNAAQHRGQHVVHCLDIRKYFPSTPSRRVFWFFHNVMKCEKDIAATLTSLATYKEHLPTGSPLSPILAYFAHFDVWQAIASACKMHSYNLTVYIDDVTISGEEVSASVMWDIKSIIHRSGLRYHKEKMYRGRPAEITGVIVDGFKLTTPNRQLKKLKHITEALKTAKWELEAKPLRERLSGLRGQMAQIASKACTTVGNRPIEGRAVEFPLCAERSGR